MNRSLLSLLVFLPALSAMASEDNALREEAKELVQQFAGQLKPALVSAMSEGGPVNAVSVCAEQAPAIAAGLSESSGWTVRRVSLKPRNSNTGEPDKWAQQILEEFDAANAAGANPATMAHAETVNGEFRFMKPQPVEGVCLACHGKTIAPPVARALARFYPDDRATGYELGDIRGAFYLTRPRAEM